MLDIATAKANLLSLYNDQAESTDAPLSRQQMADVLIDIVATLICSGTVTGTARVATTGTAAAQTGTATLTDGHIS